MITESYIREKIATDRIWLERAILAIYRNQTEFEKQVEVTAESNGVGFNGPDARTMSYYAKWILSGKSLSGNHLYKAKTRIQKYAKQLLKMAKAKEAAKAAEQQMVAA